MMRVKVCGITNLEDALAAIEYGADALGFVFYPPSPRSVLPEKAKSIIQRLPPSLPKVGVFVNCALEEVKEIVPFCGLDLVQLHGDEGPEFCAALPYPVIKAFTPQNLPPLPELARYPVAAYMFDGGNRGLESAAAHHWETARHMGRYGPVILAGGLTLENVAQAIAIASPYAVDVSRGIERAPGKKDHARMKAFLERVKPGASGVREGFLR